MNIGYVRVSTLDQNTARQLAGVELDKVFEEKISGKNLDRPGLAACLEFARMGDVLHVHSIDRLGRSLADLEAVIASVTAKGVSVWFRKEDLFFAGTGSGASKRGDEVYSKLLFQLLGCFSEFERNIINQRRLEGIRVARERGVKFGRKEALSSGQVEEIRAQAATGASKASLAAEYGVSRATVYRAISGQNCLPC